MWHDLLPVIGGIAVLLGLLILTVVLYSWPPVALVMLGCTTLALAVAKRANDRG